MATISEKFGSPEYTLAGSSSTATVEYIILNEASETAAMSLLQSTAPSDFEGIPRQSCKVEPLANDIWTGTAYYAYKTTQSEGDSVFQFETGGGTQHITQSISTIANYAAEGTASNHNGAINVTSDGPQGVDIVKPVYTWSETHYLSDATVASKKATYYALTGKVNSDGWNGYSAGEVLFLGATGSKRGREDWEVTFRFSASPNRSDVTIGGITGISAKGWEYVWLEYEDEEDLDASKTVKKPVYAHVEQVYEYAAFSGLGLT